MKVNGWMLVIGAQADTCAEVRALGQELQCGVILPDKAVVQQPVPSITSFQRSFEIVSSVDAVIGLCRTVSVLTGAGAKKK